MLCHRTKHSTFKTYTLRNTKKNRNFAQLFEAHQS